MSELRGTTRERGLPDDIDIDDIEIEDINSEDLQPVDEFDSIDVDERSADTEEDGVSPEFPDEPSRPIIESDIAVDDDFVDLEALTAEIDGMDRVDISAVDDRSAADSLIGSDSMHSHHDGQDILFENFESIDEINLDEFITDPSLTSEQRTEQDSALPESETALETDEIPFDLIDDDFLIIEEVTGAELEPEPEVRVDEKSAPLELDSLDDELVRIHGDSDGSSPGSIIEENSVGVSTEVRQADEKVIEVVSAPVRPEKKKRRSDELTIQIPEKVKKILPGNFKISDIRPIDLLEAEKIAGEDILVLTQDDLIEELDSIDLVPLDEDKDMVDDGFGEEELLDDSEEQYQDLEEKADLREEIKAIHPGQVGEAESSDMPVLEDEFNLEMDADVQEITGEVLDSGSNDEGAGSLTLTDEEEDLILSRPVEITDESDLTEMNIPAEVESSDTKPILLDDVDIFDDTISIDEIIPDEALHEDSAVIDPVLPAKERVKDAGGLPDGLIVPMYEQQTASVPSFRETIPSDLSGIDIRKNTYIIDDSFVARDADAVDTIFEKDDLEQITAGMVEVIEGESRLLREATSEEDRDNIAAIMSGTALAFEDLLIDFEDEHKFIDEDTSYIDSVFISEEFTAHERTAEDTAITRKRRKATSALEIFGLSENEIAEIESGVFAGEYRDIDLSTIDGAAKPGLDQPREDYELQEKYLYLGNAVEKLSNSEKASIEEDLSGKYAVVFEENSEDIRNILDNYRNKKRRSGDAYDISGDIVILDDKSDLDRFVETIPAEKRQNIKSLLKYLDGLFEKLPEDAIRNFAQSEYYNLYVQVLNELDR